MNCLLHDIEGENLDHGGAIRLGSLRWSGDEERLPKAHIVATNPPFGSAAVTSITFVAPTSNKRLCFYAAYY